MSQNASKPVVHMIGNAHIDPVWMWRIQEGRAEVLATYRSAIERMEETPQFIFSSGGAITYQWVQQDDPALFATIRERVAQGRWSLVNGWWVQPDCNIPCGESFVRHGLYGQRTLEAMFGRRAVTGYNVDSFGHAGSLPQILQGCGLRNYVFFRPQPGKEKDLPGTLFWWESDDGSRVLTSRPPLHYPSHPDDLVDRIDAAASEAPADVGHVMCFYGVGNHGGGPTRANIASILQAMSRPDGPEVHFGSPDGFFDIVRASGASLPTLHDELQHHARGCYTAVSKIKWYNRKCEHALLTAEKFAALAHRYLGTDYPRETLSGAWKNVLFNQFHDILAGTSIHEACQDAYAAYAQSEQIAQEALSGALEAIAAQVDTRGNGRCLLVFNPLPWAQVVPVETSLIPAQLWNEDWAGRFRPGVIHLTDDRGRAVPCQVTGIEHRGAHYLVHICFAADLPPLGYRSYRFSISADAPTWAPPPWQDLASLPAPIIENDYLRLAFDPQRGWLTSLFDKGLGVELLREPGGVPLVIDDPSDTWSHDIVSFDRVLGRSEADGNVHLVESGPVRQVVRACCRWGCSTITLDYILYAHSRQVYLDVTIDWHEQLNMLKLAFPLAVQGAQSTASIPYGSIQRRDDGGEEPCQSWVDMSGTIRGQRCGLSVLNDSKYGYDALEGELRLSLLRSPIYAFHQPRQIEAGVQYDFADQGEQVVHLALVPHAGTWAKGDAARLAASLNAPPIAREEQTHAGTWPAAASLARCDAPNVILTVIKLAEDRDGLILRGYESAGHETEAEVGIGMGNAAVSQVVRWRPHEIKTLYLEPGAAALVEVDMLEVERAP